MGFLSSLLPTMVGVGVGAMTGNPMLGAAVAGGLGYARSGSLSKGLMAGLAGYGGANLGQALAAQGMQDVAIQEGIRGQAAQQAGFGSVQDVAQPVWQTPVDSMAPEMAADNAAMAENLGKYTKAYEALNKVPTGMAGLESAGRGLASLGTGQGWSDLSANLGGPWGTAKTAVSALSPVLTQQPTVPGTAVDSSMGPRYAYQANTATPMPAPDVPGYGRLGQDFGRQQRYFTPSYTRLSDEQAKQKYGFASGGPVEQMSISNALGQNTGYPQADIRRGAYATPWQTPISRNMLTGAADVGVNPISGEMNFADGGVARALSFYDDPLGNPPGGAASAAPSSNSAPGQGISSGLTSAALGAMGLAEAAPGLSTGIMGALGAAIADSQAQSMSNANAALSAMSTVPGITTVSDESGNVFGISSPESIAAADAAIAAAADAAAAASGEGGEGGAGVSGGDGGGASGGDGGGASGGSDGGADSGGGDGGGGGGDGGGEAAGGLLRRRYAMGGLSDLGGYSDGGRLLRGPGDGVSDSIPATIANRQPARLADGEFVVPARIVSELGNGSTEAGARKLYAMMDRVQKARGKTVGKGKVAKNSRADRHLPA